MPDFPPFMKNPRNRIATASQHTPGVEDCVFDGADGSQMAFWSIERDAVTTEHVHEFDEWFIVVEGLYTLMWTASSSTLGRGRSASSRRARESLARCWRERGPCMPSGGVGRSGDNRERSLLSSSLR